MNPAAIANRKARKFGPLQLWMLGTALVFSSAPSSVFGGAAVQGDAQSTASSAPTKSPAKAPAKKGGKKKARTRGQTSPTPDRIREIQAALAKAGDYSGEPTGKWDAVTVEAMKSYQASHGLTATGKIDALTLQKLSLGSETAGLATPRTPPAKPAAVPKTPK